MVKRKVSGSLELLERLERLERRLEQRPWTTSELAQEFGVDATTVLRNIEFLETRGIHIERDTRRQGRRYWITGAQALNQVRITTYEASVLYLAARLMARITDTSNAVVISALHKLAAPLERTAPLVAQQMRRVSQLLEDQPANATAVEVLRVLVVGWLERRQVRISYPTGEASLDRIIWPYILEPLDTEQAIYVIAYDLGRNDLRTFKLDRILGAELLADTFPQPADFDPYAYIQSAWGIMVRSGEQSLHQVILEFAPSVARTIRERRWHPTQEIEDLVDGSCRFSVTVSSPDEMKRWIRRWGLHEVTVIAPQALREQLLQEAELAIQRHGRKDDHESKSGDI